MLQLALRLLALLSSVVLAGCSSPMKLTELNMPPATISDGWEVAAPADVGLDEAMLRQAYAAVEAGAEYNNARSLLVIRDGKLVAEGYFGDWTADRRQHVKSVTKSVTSLLVGIALDRGLIGSVEQKVVDLLPEKVPAQSDPRLSHMTVKHLLEMQSGLDWYENMEWLFNLSWDPNWMFVSSDTVRYVLSRPMEDRPGGHFHYSTGTSQILSGIISKVTGQPLARFGHGALFGPLGIKDPDWNAGRDGLSYGGVGLHLSPREMAKIGQLTLNRGVWNGRRIVSEDWLRASLTRRVTGYNRQGYGYHWWVGDNGWRAEGYGGQFILVRPDLNMVVVFTAREDRPFYVSTKAFMALVDNWIIPAARGSRDTGVNRPASAPHHPSR